MHLGTQSGRSIQFPRKENNLLKTTHGPIPTYVAESKVASNRPGAQNLVRRNWPAVRTAVLNRAHSPNEIALIRRLRLFDDVPSENCNTIISRACKKQFWRHHTIFSVGDPVEHVVLLLSGCVKITQQGLRGNKAILRLSGMGEVVGSFGQLSDCKYSSTAQVVEPGTALLWDAATFNELLDLCTAFRRNMLRALEECLQKMEERFRIVSGENIASRLASELIRISKHFAGAVNRHQAIRLSRTELAQLTGATLWSVSRVLNRWQQLGIVDVGREAVQILDFAALEQPTREDFELSEDSRL